jgi:hypothetical protein
MALPKQVQAQADALEQYERQVADARKANEPKPDDPPPDSPKDPQGSAPAPAPAPAPADPPKPADDDSNTWRQRYLSLQGQYNSQVPALQQQVQTLTESVSQLTQQLKVKEATPPEPAPEADLVTKKDVDAFGEDLVDLARRIAKEEFGKRETKYLKQIDALQGQLAEAKGQVGEVVESTAKSANERFFEALDSRLPGWDKVQATAECQEWLGTRIAGTTVTWDMALKDAAGRRDVKTVLEVFENFFAKHPTLNPNAAAPAPAPAKQELQRQVAPSKSSASSPTANTKRSYTGAEYQAESMRLMRMMQKGQVEEAGRLDAELNAALAEGRVTP